MKRLLFSAALLMGFAVVSFAGSPKDENKDAKTPAPTETETTTKQKVTQLYWYDAITGTELANNPSEEPEGCDIDGEGCAVGFEALEDEPLSTPTDYKRGEL